MFRRHLSRELKAAASGMPVVTLTGPRQSGKTTLVKHVFPEHAYVSLELLDERTFALEDPRGFLARFREPVILDEVRRAPDLLSYIQVAVDESAAPGRFILTGSQNLLLMESVSQSLAGRAAILHLLPLSLSELFSREPLDPRQLHQPVRKPKPPPADLWTTLWKGFYPRIHEAGLDANQWLSDYQRTYVERDLREVLRVLELDVFERFMVLVAARTAQELNLSALASDVGISQPTAKHWLNALRVGFLVTLLPPHHVSYRKRLRKTPKLHFLDTGLVCYLLGIRDAATLERHPLRGAIFESFVVGELMNAFQNERREAPLFFWRDATRHEIDILVDFGDRLLPIEVKSGLTLGADAGDGLRWWLELPGNDNAEGTPRLSSSWINLPLEKPSSSCCRPIRVSHGRA